MPRALHLEAWRVRCIGGEALPVSTTSTVTPATVGDVAGRVNDVPEGATAPSLATVTPDDRTSVLPGISWSAARACPPAARATRHARPRALLTEVLVMEVPPTSGRERSALSPRQNEWRVAGWHSG